MKDAEDYIYDMDGESDGFQTRYDFKDVKQAMIEFAKMHVEAALKEASENVDLYQEKFTENILVDKDSILNAYPLTNIK